jgi:hypothetical protein
MVAWTMWTHRTIWILPGMLPRASASESEQLTCSAAAERPFAAPPAAPRPSGSTRRTGKQISDRSAWPARRGPRRRRGPISERLHGRPAPIGRVERRHTGDGPIAALDGQAECSICEPRPYGRVGHALNGARHKSRRGDVRSYVVRPLDTAPARAAGLPSGTVGEPAERPPAARRLLTPAPWS